MTDDELQSFSEKAFEFLQAQQDSTITDFRLGEYERYDWDQETQQLTWSDEGIPKVVADIQFVGSISTISNTWLWSRANPSVIDSMSNHLNDVRRFGEKHSISKLVEEKWPADELDGWEMTAISAYILRSKGAYRAPGKNGFTFMVFSEIRFVDDSES